MTSNPLLYLETSVVSYLVGRPSRDLVMAAHQQLTIEWWEAHRPRFQIFVSELVLDEAGAGDPEAAQRRLAMIRQLPLLAVTQEALDLAALLIRRSLIPRQADADALHIALATTHGMEYLPTWNCRHIANAETRGRISSLCRKRGDEPPALCTPEEPMGR